MKIKLFRQFHVFIVVAFVAIMASGCWTANHHTAYRAIHQYAINGDVAAVAAELAQHPDELNLPEDHELTALHLAAENCHTNVVALLLDKGATINVRADDLATPLHLAAQEGCTDVVTLLLARSAKINLRDNQSRTPLDRAKQWQQDDTVKLLKQHGGIE